MKVDYDLENSPLQIRTNSEIGSEGRVDMYFYNPAGDHAGSVSVHLESSPQYDFGWCSSRRNFPTGLPSDTDKTWTISLVRTSSEIRIVMLCNEKEVLNVALSDTTCTSESEWKTTWNRDVEQIKFSSYDTASDYYRPG